MGARLIFVSLVLILGCISSIPGTDDNTSPIDRTIDVKGPINVPKGVSTQYLTYGSQRVRLDIYNPGSANVPAVILVHGSAGIEGDRGTRYKGFATGLMDRGILAINVHYFDSPQPYWERTIVKTISFAELIPNVDKKRIGLVGYSLGGIISLKVASVDDRVSLLATNGGYLPPGFTSSDAKRLPRTFMVAGSEDTAVNDLYKVRDWCKSEGIPFEGKIDQGIGHDNVPMNVFEEDWAAIEGFFAKNFNA